MTLLDLQTTVVLTSWADLLFQEENTLALQHDKDLLRSGANHVDMWLLVQKAGAKSKPRSARFVMFYEATKQVQQEVGKVGDIYLHDSDNWHVYECFLFVVGIWADYKNGLILLNNICARQKQKRLQLRRKQSPMAQEAARKLGGMHQKPILLCEQIYSLSLNCTLSLNLSFRRIEKDSGLRQALIDKSETT